MLKMYKIVPQGGITWSDIREEILTIENGVCAGNLARRQILLIYLFIYHFLNYSWNLPAHEWDYHFDNNGEN